MKKYNVVSITTPEAEAQGNFASHVQSIAFNLTLSRRMIDCLQTVRDYGWPHLADNAPADQREERRAQGTVVERPSRSGGVAHNFVGFMDSLRKRGLILWDTTPHHERRVGQRLLTLSKAGQLVCELLVEARLMDAAPEKKKKRGT